MKTQSIAYIHHMLYNIAYTSLTRKQMHFTVQTISCTQHLKETATHFIDMTQQTASRQDF